MTEKEFWESMRKEKATKCWLWLRGQRGEGYGVVWFKGKTWATHRLAFVLRNGPIPARQLVRHTCDTPACCNPAHLLSGTRSDNVHDAQSRGRYKPPPFKVDPSEYPKIVERRRNGEKLKPIANDYNVSTMTILQITRKAGLQGRMRFVPES
jgi:hypothetical protein